MNKDEKRLQKFVQKEIYFLISSYVKKYGRTQFIKDLSKFTYDRPRDRS